MTVTDPVPAALAAILAALNVAPSVTAYEADPGPRGYDKLPVGVVGSPTFEPPGLWNRGEELGKDDLTTLWPVSIGVSMVSGFTAARSQATKIVDTFIKDVQANPTLSGAVQQAAVIGAVPDFGQIGTNGPVLFIYDVQVSVYQQY